MKASAKITTLILMSIFSVGAWAAVDSISPNKGPVTGGQKVRIRGTGFAATGNTVTLQIGTGAVVNATVDAQSTTVIDVTIPAYATDGSATLTVVGGGTGTYTYIARNNQLQVVVSASIAKRVLLQWGATTSTDDAGNSHNAGAGLYSPFAWTVKDSNVLPAGQIELATSYRSDDFNNDKTIIVRNASSGADVSVSAIATESGDFSLVGAIVANDQVRLLGSLGTGTLSSLHAVQTLDANIAAGSEEPLVLQFDSPTGLTTATFATIYTFTITLTAAAL